MITITRITNIDNKKHIALLDTSSISFMQGLEVKGVPSNDILRDYDLSLFQNGCWWKSMMLKAERIICKN